jgi:SAM-dependent methyltransferase
VTVPFRRDLYRGTAEAYDRFRPPYPPALIDDLRSRVPLGSESRVLDLACGTGQIAFALAGHVAEVWAVDPEASMLELGARKASRSGVVGIRWVTGTAEDVALDGTFDLVAIGNAFHRLDREAVAARLVPHLAPGGGIALLWGGSPWEGDRPWQQVLGEVLERWTDTVGARDRVPAGWREAIERVPHEEVLRRAGLVDAGTVRVTVEQRWSVESLVGFAHSTSFLNHVALGRHADAFARDLAHALLACRPDGVFVEEATFACQVARRPPGPAPDESRTARRSDRHG